LHSKEGLSVNGTSHGPQELERAITVPDMNRKMAEEVERVAVAGKVLVYAITKRHVAEIARYSNAAHPLSRRAVRGGDNDEQRGPAGRNQTLQAGGASFRL
jgi:hypothetical protein